MAEITFEKVNGALGISVDGVLDALFSNVPLILIPSKDNKSITIWAGGLSFPYTVAGNTIKMGFSPFAGNATDLAWKMTAYINFQGSGTSLNVGWGPHQEP